MNAHELVTVIWAMHRLKHVPDMVYMECWYAAAVARMPSFSASNLAVAIHALGVLQPGKDAPGAVSGRFIAVVLPRVQALIAELTGTELGQVLWGLAELKIKPGDEFMNNWMSGEGTAWHELRACQYCANQCKYSMRITIGLISFVSE